MSFNEWFDKQHNPTLEDAFNAGNDPTKDLLIGRLSIELENTRLKLDELFKLHGKMVDEIRLSLRKVEHPMYY